MYNRELGKGKLRIKVELLTNVVILITVLSSSSPYFLVYFFPCKHFSFEFLAVLGKKKTFRRVIVSPISDFLKFLDKKTSPIRYFSFLLSNFLKKIKTILQLRN